MNLDAELSADSPVNQLPEFLRDSLSGVFPSQLSWSANVTYDMVTQKRGYSIDESSLTQVSL